MTHPLVPIADSSIATDNSLLQQSAESADQPRTWGVGIVGLGQQGLFQLERIQLCAEVRVTAAFDPNPQRRNLAAGLECDFADELSSVIESTATDAVFLTEELNETTAAEVLRGGRHLVIDRPWMLTHAELLSIHHQAQSSQRIATYFCPWRWTADFLVASTAIRSGRVGELRTVLFSSFMKHLPGDPGNAGPLREFGFGLLDQMLTLVNSRPESVFATFPFHGQQVHERGFTALIRFENGCLSQLSLESDSRLGYRTGWMLEGIQGSYRGERLYTETPDGEIVDEPIQRPNFVHDPFLTELISAWHGKPTTLPSLADAARIVTLINAIERSAETGHVVRL